MLELLLWLWMAPGFVVMLPIDWPTYALFGWNCDGALSSHGPPACVLIAGTAIWGYAAIRGIETWVRRALAK